MFAVCGFLQYLDYRKWSPKLFWASSYSLALSKHVVGLIQHSPMTKLPASCPPQLLYMHGAIIHGLVSLSITIFLSIHAYVTAMVQSKVVQLIPSDEPQ